MSASLDDDPSFLLARANALSVQAGNAALTPHGLRVRSYSVLARSEAGSTQRDLAEHLRLDPSQVVALVDELEGRGLVSRKTDPADRRQKVVRSTASGRRLLAAAEKDLRAAESRLHAGLTPAQRDALVGLLGALAFPDGRIDG